MSKFLEKSNILLFLLSGSAAQNAGSHPVHALHAQSRVFTPWPEMPWPCRCGQTKAKHMQSTLGSPGPFGTAEGSKNMTTTPETSLEVNAGSHRACNACARPRFHSLAFKAASVQSNQGETHAIHTWLSRPIWYCRGPQKHDNDTGDVARGQRWFTPCMHCVRKAEFLLLGLKARVGAVKPRQNTRNPHLALQAHLVLPRAAKT